MKKRLLYPTFPCRAQLEDLMAKVQLLKDKYDASMAAKASLEAELDDLNVSLLIFVRLLILIGSCSKMNFLLYHMNAYIFHLKVFDIFPMRVFETHT